MHYQIVKYFIILTIYFKINQLSVSSCFYLNPKGPIHGRLAVECLEEIVKNHFYFLDNIDLQHPEEFNILLLTVMVTSNLTSPGYEIQQNFIKQLNLLTKWPIEIINDNRFEFKSYTYCTNCLVRPKVKKIYRKQFVPKYQTYFTVLIVESIENFVEKFQILQELDSYDSRGLFLVYYSNHERNFQEIAFNILLKLWKKQIVNSLILIPQNLKILDLYSLNVAAKRDKPCGKSPILTRLDYCQKGEFQTKLKYYENRLGKTFNNCTLEVLAMPIEPFVINSNEGFEIELLQVIGNSLQIHFNITLNDLLISWGNRINDQHSWTNGLGKIYNDNVIGIGNMAQKPEYIIDFDFTVDYFIENLSWIVPIAKLVPKWRVLTIIFSLDLWGVCLGVLITCAILFFSTSYLSHKEVNYYKNLNNNFFMALQIIITSAVFKQPLSSFTRIVFLSLAIFSIIISSVYTSSLINYLTNPKREHQICSLDDILSSGLGVGGLDIFRSIFDNSSEEVSMKLFNMYQTSLDENDTITSWLNTVGNQRNICTVYSKFYVKYLISQGNPVVTDNKQRPTVYIIPTPLYSYSLSIVTKKGHPLLNKFNNIIRYMFRGGLIIKMAAQYNQALKKLQELEDGDDDDDTTLQKLSLDHFQGAFAIIILGYIMGTVCFVMEIFIRKVCVKKKL